MRIEFDDIKILGCHMLIKMRVSDEFREETSLKASEMNTFQNGEVNFIVEVEPNDVVESDFEQQQNVILNPASSSPRKDAPVRSAMALQGV